MKEVRGNMAELNNGKSEPRTRADLLRKTPDPVDILLKYLNSGFRGITGSPFNFCRVLCEMTEGMSGDRKGDGAVYGWYTLGGQKKDIIQFKDEYVYEIIYEINGEITLHSIEQKEYQRIRPLLNVHPLSVLISKFEMEKEYKAAFDIFKRKQNEEKQRQEAEKRRSEQEDGIDAVLKKIERAHSDDVLFPLRGIHMINALIEQGYEPGVCDNPDLWVDAEDFASLYYTDRKNGEELLLIGREKLQAVTERARVEYKFVVVKSADKPKDFLAKYGRFNRAKEGEPPRNWTEEFFKGLDILTTYPEELKNRTVADLDVMAGVIDGVIVERSRIEEGLLPYDSLFNKETGKILADVAAAQTPLSEIRKNLDYFEHTGMVPTAYRDSLYELIKMKAAGIALYDLLATGDREGTLGLIRELPRHHEIDIRKILEGIELTAVSQNPSFKEYVYTNGAVGASRIHHKRIKEIVTMILKNIKGEINEENITVAMLPFVGELGLDELDRMKNRILELKEVVASQQRKQNEPDRT